MYIEGEIRDVGPGSAAAREATGKLDHWWCRICSSRERRFMPTYPAASLREKSGTFTNTDRRVQLAREVIKPPAMRGRICGSSRKSPGAWGSTGAMTGRRTCSPDDAVMRRCEHYLGAAWCARAGDYLGR